MSQPTTVLSDYPHTSALETRWMDNDAYAHVNNVVYYSFFDTLVNRMLTEAGLLDITKSPIIGLVVESQCRYFAPVAFPDRLIGGLRVGHLGNSSVRYELAIFRTGADSPVAEGHFIHVYVDRMTRKPAAIPEAMRRYLATLTGCPQSSANA